MDRQKKFLTKLLKRIDPSVEDPCGTPRNICSHSLKDKPNSTLYYF